MRTVAAFLPRAGQDEAAAAMAQWTEASTSEAKEARICRIADKPPRSLHLVGKGDQLLSERVGMLRREPAVAS